MKKIIMVCLVLMICLNFLTFSADCEEGTVVPVVERTVLVELFTSTKCVVCPGAEGALHRLADEYPRTQLTIIEWHPNSRDFEDEYQPVDGSSDEREAFYKIGGYPTAYFDGVERETGGSEDPDDEGAYDRYKEQIEKRRKVSSPLIIRTDGYIENNIATVNVEITATDTVNEENLYVYFVLYNDHNEWVDGEAGENKYILRYTALESQNSSISIEKGGVVTRSRTFTLKPEWDVDKLGVVTFVQTHDRDRYPPVGPYVNYYTAEILQSDDLKFTGSDVFLTPGVTSKNIAVGESAKFNVEIKNTGVINDTYELVLNKNLPSGWSSFVCIDDLCYPTLPMIVLSPNEKKTVNVTISSADTAWINDTGSVTFTVYSKSNAHAMDYVTLTATVTSILPVDSDDDGYTDEEEIAAGTDPNDPNDYPGAADDEENGKGFIPGFEIGALIIALGLIFILRKRFVK
ncbi:MAG: hypothetical protein L6265_09935 [Thermoplasmatales archaeon]|nr:hypothetical protein [Thermoplasmatales archaeon]